MSALESIYGRTAPAAPAARGNARERAAAAYQAEATAATWSHLFDVPSHALPGVFSLCTSFLELLTRRPDAQQS